MPTRIGPGHSVYGPTGDAIAEGVARDNRLAEARVVGEPSRKGKRPNIGSAVWSDQLIGTYFFVFFCFFGFMTLLL